MTATWERAMLVGVEQDHCGFEQLLVRFKEVEPTERDDLFWEFVASLARHEIVEEVVIHPAPRLLGRDTEAPARAAAAEGSTDREARCTRGGTDRPVAAGETGDAADLRALPPAPPAGGARGSAVPDGPTPAPPAGRRVADAWAAPCCPERVAQGC